MFTAVTSLCLCSMHACDAEASHASLVFIFFVYVYVVIVNKHRTCLWITWNFVYVSRICVNHKPAELTRIGTRSQGQLFDGLVNLDGYQSFAHKLPGGLYKSYPEGGVDKLSGLFSARPLARTTCRGHLLSIRAAGGASKWTF